MHTSLKVRFLIAITVVFLLIIAVMAGVFSARLSRSVQDRVKDTLTNALHAGSYIIDGDFIARLTPEESVEDYAYGIWEGMKRIHEDFGLAYLYTLRPANGGLEFALDTGDDPRLVEDDDNSFTMYDDAPEEAFTALETGRMIITDEPYTDDWGTFLSAYAPLKDSSGRIVAVLASDKDIGEVKMITRNTIITSIAPIVLGTLLLGLLLRFVLQRIVISPILSVCSALEEIAQGGGDLTKRLRTGTGDELSRMAESYNAFADRMSLIVSNLRKSVDRAVGVKEVMVTSAEETATSISQIESTIETIRKAMENIDQQINESKEKGTDMARRIGELGETSEIQKKVASESFAAVETMINGITRIASITERSEEASRLLKEKSARGGERIGKTASVVSQIHREVETISDMLKLINSIAAQTNMLAMNAAIEAAHAGAYGRGFAVVAEEIRKLADDSGRNSKKIGEALKLIIGKIAEASASSDDSQKAFHEIAEGIEGSFTSFDEIRMSAAQLAAGSEQIRKAMESLRDTSVKVDTTADHAGEESRSVISALSSSTTLSNDVNRQIAEITYAISQISKAMREVAGYAQELDAVTDEIQSHVGRFVTSDSN